VRPAAVSRNDERFQRVDAGWYQKPPISSSDAGDAR
jgi:hypothetical protein